MNHSRIICFDLEGPLSPQDNAYELMSLFPGGARIFEAISRYDDLLALEGKTDYEPGDTLALIVPFLLYHQIKEEDIRKLAQKAKLVEGAAELVYQLHSRAWKVFCISTSYEQYALHITKRVGIPEERVSCTAFPLNRYRQILGEENFIPVERIESILLSLHPGEDDGQIKACLDSFFWRELPSQGIGRIIKKIKPVGGRRKVEALNCFAREYGCSLKDFVVVGDSITDAKMLEAVNKAEGLAIAFNANEHALPYATLGLASRNISDLTTICDAWEYGGIRSVEGLVKAKEEQGGRRNREYFHWLRVKRDLKPVLAVHHKIRRLVREEAAKLG